MECDAPHNSTMSNKRTRETITESDIKEWRSDLEYYRNEFRRIADRGRDNFDSDDFDDYLKLYREIKSIAEKVDIPEFKDNEDAQTILEMFEARNADHERVKRRYEMLVGIARIRNEIGDDMDELERRVNDSPLKFKNNERDDLMDMMCLLFFHDDDSSFDVNKALDDWVVEILHRDNDDLDTGESIREYKRLSRSALQMNQIRKNLLAERKMRV